MEVTVMEWCYGSDSDAVNILCPQLCIQYVSSLCSKKTS